MILNGGRGWEEELGIFYGLYPAADTAKWYLNLNFE
jgi:hypothetical protein